MYTLVIYSNLSVLRPVSMFAVSPYSRKPKSDRFPSLHIFGQDNDDVNKDVDLDLEEEAE